MVKPEVNSIRLKALVKNPRLVGMDREERAIAYQMRNNPKYTFEDILDFHT